MAATNPTATPEVEATTRAIQFQAPAELIDRLDALCKGRGLDRTRVMNRAMEAAVSYLDSLPDPLDGMTFGRPNATGGFVARAVSPVVGEAGPEATDDDAVAFPS